VAALPGNIFVSKHHLFVALSFLCYKASINTVAAALDLFEKDRCSDICFDGLRSCQTFVLRFCTYTFSTTHVTCGETCKTECCCTPPSEPRSLHASVHVWITCNTYLIPDIVLLRRGRQIERPNATILEKVRKQLWRKKRQEKQTHQRRSRRV